MLNSIFFPKNYISLERSPLDEAKKKYKTNEKVEMSKMPTVKFVTKKWVNRRHFFIDEKNLQLFGLATEVISV